MKSTGDKSTRLDLSIQCIEGGQSRGTMQCHLKRERKKAILCNISVPEEGLGGKSKGNRDWFYSLVAFSNVGNLD